MPPPKGNAPKKAPVSASRELVPVGPREVFVKNASRRDENGNKPLTAKALVLRNGKYGTQGTGELMVLGKMSGREKLELLAGDLIEQAKKAIGTPFRLEQCLKIADSQLAANLDEISDLRDPELFTSKIEAEVRARSPLIEGRNAPDPLNNRSYVASIVAARIHNTHMMASAWRIIGDTFRDMAEEGVDDSTIKIQLMKDGKLRQQFLVLYDIVNIVAEAAQAKFALLATTAPHYSRYFKKIEDGDIDEPEYAFDWAGLKEVHKSFIDSIIVELCLPQSSIPKQILLQILHEAIEETSRDAKRFPQAIWDAVGDLSVVVQLQEYLESPLLGPEGEAWKKLPREMPQEYEDWVDAQIYSEKASKLYANFKDSIYPLEKTKKQYVLDNMWKFINLNHESVCGKDIDTLWQLDHLKQRTPQWHAVYMPKGSIPKGNKDNKADDTDDDMPSLVPIKAKLGSGGKPRKQLLAITNGSADDSDDSMPSLQTVSDDSSEDDFEDESSDGFDDDDDDDSEGSETGYDTDEEDALREMIREAMDTAMATPEFFDPKAPAPELDALAEERKDNPFLKLLGSLRGRMFSANPTLKTTSLTQPKRPSAPGKAAPAPPSQASTKARSTPTLAPEAAPKSHKATVETVEDEEEATAKKKKKKAKKKKKKPTAGASTEGEPATPVIQQEPATPPTPATSATPPPAPKAPVATSPTSQKKAPTPKSPSKPTPARTSLASSSTASLPHIPLTQTKSAQSAHKYLQTEGLATGKTKVKSRPDHGNLAPVPEKKGLWNRFKRKDKPDAEPEDEDEKKGSKFSFFSKLSKKTAPYMHQLLSTSQDEKKGIAPMKWEHFLKVMREMGFEYDPSTAGSSVRFDPPDPRDVPITIHKPHPDTTFYPVMLKNISKRLKNYYGWSEEDFYKATRE